MYLFLQNFRATLIPTIAVPVVLLGTFGVLAALGFSINTLTMFAMVLAIGLLVDDAIVVVENVERVMSEEGLSPQEATRKSMDQITGALVGIALVLAAVFVPMAFFGGSTGVIYRQFSITIVSAMALSVLVALIAHAGAVRDDAEARREGASRASARLLRLVQPRLRPRAARATSARSAACSRRSRPLHARLRRAGRRCSALLFVRAADRASCPTRTRASCSPGAAAAGRDAGAHAATVLRAGRAALPRGREGHGRVGVHRRGLQLRRPRPEHRHRLRQAQGLGRAQGDRAARAARSPAARWARSRRSRTRWCSRSRRRPVLELGNATGFELQLQDRAGARPRGADRGAQPAARPRGARTRCSRTCGPNGLEDTPQFQHRRRHAEGRRARAVARRRQRTRSPRPGAAPTSNDFIDRAASKRVYMQADAPFRMLPEDLDRWYVRNAQGEMVPFSAFATGALDLRLAAAGALQRRARDRDPGRAGAGRELRRGDGGDGAAGGAAAARHRPRVDGPVVRGAAVRRAGAAALRAVAARRVPVPRGAVRELVDPGRR